MKIRNIQSPVGYKIVGNHTTQFMPCVCVNISEYREIEESKFTGQFMVRNQKYRNGILMSEHLEKVVESLPCDICIKIDHNKKPESARKSPIVRLEDLFVCGDLLGLKIKDVSNVLNLLEVPIDRLDLTVRPLGCCLNAGIKTVGDLVQKTMCDLLKFRNFGKKSLAEIQEKLNASGLRLGMTAEEAGSWEVVK